jgi:hypothetical protein
MRSLGVPFDDVIDLVDGWNTNTTCARNKNGEPYCWPSLAGGSYPARVTEFTCQ